MTNLDSNSSSEYNPWYYLTFLLAFVIVGLFIFNFIGFVIAIFFVGFDFNELLRIMENPMSGPETRVPLLVVQGVTGIGTFIIVPWLFKKYVDRSGEIQIESNSDENFNNYLIVCLFTFSIMPFTAKLMELNQDLHFPQFLAEFERKARLTHDFIEATTNHLIDLDGPMELILGILVIGVIPAIGEEYLFRGFLQKYLIRAFQNPHLGILSTAIIFGVFHLQVFVLLPRILLGFVYGYFYHYSNNIRLPMLAHFLNNSFMVIMLYLYNKGMIDYNIDDESGVSIILVLMSLLISSLLFFYLESRFSPNPQNG